jgi:hypothetical protein
LVPAVAGVPPATPLTPQITSGSAQ